MSPDLKEVTLLATSEWGALLDTLAAVRMDLSHIAESKSMPEKAKVERLRFAIVAIDAVAAEVKKGRRPRLRRPSGIAHARVVQGALRSRRTTATRDHRSPSWGVVMSPANSRNQL